MPSESKVPAYRPVAGKKYLIPMAKTAIVIIPVTIKGLVMALENSMPCALYEMMSVEMNMAGNPANNPPVTGPAILSINTADATIKPPKTDLKASCFNEGKVLP